MVLDEKNLKLDMRSLSQGINHLRIPLELTGINWDLEGVEPAEDTGLLDLYAELDKSRLLVTGDLEAEFLTPCARCLKPTRFAVSEEIWREYSMFEEDCLEGDVHLIPDSGMLDILDAVREAVMLSTPGKPLCSPECPGISYI